jgi:hypothetical protein
MAQKCRRFRRHFIFYNQGNPDSAASMMTASIHLFVGERWFIWNVGTYLKIIFQASFPHQWWEVTTYPGLTKASGLYSPGDKRKIMWRPVFLWQQSFHFHAHGWSRFFKAFTLAKDCYISSLCKVATPQFWSTYGHISLYLPWRYGQLVKWG